MVWDTETTELYQNLKFGYFEILQNRLTEYTGLFYDKEFLSRKEFDILESYSKLNKIQLYTLEQFREIFLSKIYTQESLWNCKEKIKSYQFNKISIKLKLLLIFCVS